MTEIRTKKIISMETFIAEYYQDKIDASINIQAFCTANVRFDQEDRDPAIDINCTVYSPTKNQLKQLEKMNFKAKEQVRR